MPWYDFQCESCGSVFEIQRAMNETRKAKCKYCGSTKTVKIYSAAGIAFKGSGFYVTDSKSAGSGSTPAGTPVTPAETPAADSGGSAEKTTVTETAARPERSEPAPARKSRKEPA
jgi:putative FmdB family regulatory protein